MTPYEPLDDNQEWLSQRPGAEEIHTPNENQFILLCVLTLGLYAVWWMYKTWRFFDEREGQNLLPALRAILAIFFLPGLLNRILGFAQERGYTESYSPLLLYLGYIILNLTGYLPDPYFFIALTAYLLLLPPYRAFYSALDLDPGYNLQLQDTFNNRQWLLVALGATMWLFIIAGMLMPPDAAY